MLSCESSSDRVITFQNVISVCSDHACQMVGAVGYIGLYDELVSKKRTATAVPS